VRNEGATLRLTWRAKCRFVLEHKRTRSPLTGCSRLTTPSIALWLRAVKNPAETIANSIVLAADTSTVRLQNTELSEVFPTSDVGDVHFRTEEIHHLSTRKRPTS
jgi:hypothetical protein